MHVVKINDLDTEALQRGVARIMDVRWRIVDARHSIRACRDAPELGRENDLVARNDHAATIATKRVFRAPRVDHPAVDLEAQAALFESPEKFRRMSEFLERKPK